MIEFEKWFDKSGEEIIDTYHNHYSSLKEIIEDTWKAALKWAINNEFVVDKIYEELNEKDYTNDKFDGEE